MRMEVTRELTLEGLDCANCAAKIERGVQDLPGVKSASLDFITKKLQVEMREGHESSQVTGEIRNLVQKIEPDVELIEGTGYAPEKADSVIDRTAAIQFGLSVLIFGIAFAFTFSVWVEFSLFFISYLLSGHEVVFKAFRNLLKGQVLDENFLMTVATIGAFSIGEFPEGAAVMLFFQLGELLQSFAVNRSRKSIADLMDIRPDYAVLKSGDEYKKVSPEVVCVGDIILVRPGEKIPLDGEVMEGFSMVDTSALTGESLPREVEIGSNVLGGFINKNGLLSIRVSKKFGESTLSKVLEMVQNAGSRKAPTESFITKFARHYTPAVTGAALAIALIPPLFVPGAVFSEWLYRAMIFLVISCPCALVVSIPLGFFGGIGGASKNGILVKGGNYLEALNDVDTIVFDKTGTLTQGVFCLSELHPEDGFNEEELLEYAALVEAHSNHPIAISVREAFGIEINNDEIESYEDIPGYGVKANARGHKIIAGNARLMTVEGLPFHDVETAGTQLHVAVDGRYAGYIIIADQIKEDAQKAIKRLKNLGVRKVFMLTGDVSVVARQVGEKLGLDGVYAELLPDQKVEMLEEIEKSIPSKGKLIFVGDGVNDAPVLARADVGVAMGALGSDAAIEAADVVLMTDEPNKLADAVVIARRTRNIVWQNIFFALGVKIAVLILGAGGIATLWEAVFADVGVALIAVANSMRVMRVKL